MHCARCRHRSKPILRNNVKVVQSKFEFGDELSIADDDRGGDPYNNTGAYCIIKSERYRWRMKQ